ETKRRLSGLKANVAAYGTVCLRVKEPRGCRHTTTCRPPINENLANPEAIHSPSRLYANWVTQLKSLRYEPISVPVVASRRTISPSRPRASSRPSQLKAAHCAGLSKSSDAREAKSQTLTLIFAMSMSLSTSSVSAKTIASFPPSRENAAGQAHDRGAG